MQAAGGREPFDGRLGRLYDAIENPRSTRGELPILRGEECRAYMSEVRERALEALEDVDLSPDAEDPLLRDGFVYELVLAHEHQHNETMLQLLQMLDGYEPLERDAGPTAEPVERGHAPPRAEGPPVGPAQGPPVGPAQGPPVGPAQGPPVGPAQGPPVGPEMVLVEGGSREIGAPPLGAATAGGAGSGFAYDNERPRHTVELPPFRIDRAPVVNAAFADFVADTGAEPPLYWEPDGEGGWVTTYCGRREPLDPARPVIHVDWHQAAAFAAWAGKRLPTELEWEVAAAGADRDRANLDRLGFGCAPAPIVPASARSASASDVGAVQMLGDVWEWTCSHFTAYPGFAPFPYPEYSQPFFGDGHRVLRGGSWATRRNVIRTSFRNWDLPERRQIFAGFRCAVDVEPPPRAQPRPAPLAGPDEVSRTVRR